MATLAAKILHLTGLTRDTTVSYAGVANRKPYLFLSVFVAWGLVLLWFHPRLSSILIDVDNIWHWMSLGYFVIFVEIAWLYGIYNIAIVIFSIIDRYLPKDSLKLEQLSKLPTTPVALLYTTCNDFVESSAHSCVNLHYRNYKMYILDDSSDDAYKKRVDDFAKIHQSRVTVIRRKNRKGYKAGNLNNALANHVYEPLFAIVDADEILPRDFLHRMVPRLLSDSNCGFVQANHICSKHSDIKLTRDLAAGIDIHWKWYQPLRNRFGFVMFLGHGALLRRSCWKQVNGFPELVSEDLAYAISIREHGYYGTFAEDVVCMEDFPPSVRAFRIRHMKWTRGTCEFLANCLPWLIRSRHISLTEKLDIIFPTINLPLTFLFFIFMINAGIVLPFMLGDQVDVTFVINNTEFIIPMLTMPEQFLKLYSLDFYTITVITILAPVLCFIIEMCRTPFKLYKFLSHSTALYSALSPMTTVAVFGYLLTRKARFLVTADNSDSSACTNKQLSFISSVKQFFSETHPDHWAVRQFEVGIGVLFMMTAMFTFQVSFIGLAFGFMLMPIMHRIDWNNWITQTLVWLPFGFMLLGIALGGMGVFGLYPVFFGYGFHF